MRDAEPVGDARGIVDILAGAAGALAADGGAMVVELQGDADDLEAALDQQRRRHRGIDAARHRHDDAAIGRVAGKIEVLCNHGDASRPICQKSASSREAVAKLAASEGKRPSPPRRANCSSSAASASRGKGLIVGAGIHVEPLAISVAVEPGGGIGHARGGDYGVADHTGRQRRFEVEPVAGERRGRGRSGYRRSSPAPRARPP